MAKPDIGQVLDTGQVVKTIETLADLLIGAVRCCARARQQEADHWHAHYDAALANWTEALTALEQAQHREGWGIPKVW